MSSSSNGAAEPKMDALPRWINPGIRRYMHHVSLERFYGCYAFQDLAPQILNLGLGEVGNVPLAEDPVAIYRRFLEQNAELTPHIARYAGTRGDAQTNERLAAWFNAWLGCERIDSERVASFDGGHNAIEAAVRVFTSPLGSTESPRQYVLCAAPSYPYISSLIAAHAGLRAFLAYSSEELVRGLERHGNHQVGMILLNIPHNPLGYALDAAQVRRINALAQRLDCVIVVDAVYANFAPELDVPELNAAELKASEPNTAAQESGVGAALAGLDAERTVFIDSFSKKFGYPGLRIGFALSANAQLIDALRFVKIAESISPSVEKLAFAAHLLRGIPPCRVRLPRMCGSGTRPSVNTSPPPPPNRGACE